MQRVARALDVTPMSLYHYVDSKGELLAVMVDTAVGPPESSIATLGWRVGLQCWAQALVERRLAHPWTVEILPTRPPLTPNLIGWTELGLAVLTGTGLEPVERLSVLLAVDGWSQHHVRQCVGMGLVGVPAADSPPGQYAQHLEALISADDFPQLTGAYQTGLPTGVDYHTEEFARGIALLLDGVGALIGRGSPADVVQHSPDDLAPRHEPLPEADA